MNKFVIVFFKKDNFFLYRKRRIVGINIINGDDFNISDSIFINLLKDRISFQNINEVNTTGYETVNIGSTNMTETQCLNILDWLNSDENKLHTNNVEFIIRFLNILNFRKFFSLKSNISENKLYKTLKSKENE